MNVIQRFITHNPCYIDNVNRVDYRYIEFQDHGPKGLMLHSVGCAQPSAMTFANRWDNAAYAVAVHAFIDANSGDIVQVMPWNFRAWHCGGSANNTHIGIEMCESGAIKYTQGATFEILDRTKAVEDCVRAYCAAVELFAFLCVKYGLNPLTDICSHKEGGYRGIASGHVDPEHYWKQLGMNYTMDGFREAVRQKMEDVLSMTVNELKTMMQGMITETVSALLDEKLPGIVAEQIGASVQGIVAAQMDGKTAAILDLAGQNAANTAKTVVENDIGKYIKRLPDIPSKSVRASFKPLLDEGYINGGTPREVDDEDVYLPYSVVRALLVMKKYTDSKAEEMRGFVRGLLTDEADPEGGDPESECGETCPIVFDEAPGAGEEE